MTWWRKKKEELPPEAQDDSPTEIPEANQVPEALRAPTYEPKRKFRWILEVDGLKPFYVKSCSGFIFPAGSTLKVQFYEAVDEPVSESLLKWAEAKEARPASLKFLDPVGEVVQEWVFHDFRLNVSSFDELDYADSDPVTISCNFIYSSVALRIDFEQ